MSDETVIDDLDIALLEHDAAAAGDGKRSALCQLALGTESYADEAWTAAETSLSPEDRHWLATLGVAGARAECARILAQQ